MAKRKWLITVHSQKGGVGKTLLAFYLARRIADTVPGTKYKEKFSEDYKGQPFDGMAMKAVLVDADLTGTSLAHVLDLEAPKPDGSGYFSTDRTNGMLKGWSEAAANAGDSFSGSDNDLTVLNQSLFFDPHEYKSFFKDSAKSRAELMLWRLSTDRREDQEEGFEFDFDNLRIIPSSGFARHVQDSIPHIYKEDVTSFLEYRLSELVWWLWHDAPGDGFDVVVIDTSPVLAGMSKAVLRLHESLKKRHKEKGYLENDIGNLAIMVSSADIQDMVGLTNGLDSLAFRKESRVILPLKEKIELDDKERYKLRLSNILLIINRVPKDLPIFMERAKTKGHYKLQIDKYLHTQGVELNKQDIFDTFFKDQVSIINFDKTCAEMFAKDRITYRPIPVLESLYEKISEVINNV